MREKILKIAVVLLCVLGLDICKGGAVVYAKAEQSTASFSGDVEVLKQENNGYVIQVTVENSGEDFTGTVQVIFAGSDYVNSAYNTEITLPAQGKKQFTINVAGTAVDTASGMCAIHFLDERENVLQSVQHKYIFGNVMTEVPAGVLSDNYAGLAFMEAKGETINFHNRSYPVKLVELERNHLKDQLDGIYFLIIDQFDVSSLAREDIEAIQDWTKGGGWLIIGTGEYAEQTLSGFDHDFIGVSASDISEPGEENFLSAHADPYGYDYYMYTDDGIDFTNMAVADLDYNNVNGYLSSENPAIIGFVGDGSAMIFGCSLGNEEMQKVNKYTVTYMYEELTNASSGYQFDDYPEWDYINERALAFIDNIRTNVDFTGLKVMIILYVVLVGPVLYLILRRAKRSEWYWVCVPALGVLFIAGVYFLGQGAQVREAKVYSVTAQRVDSSRKDTYYLAYHSGTKPWTVPLKADYETAGPGSSWSSYYYGGYGQNTDDYHYIVDNGGESLSAGIKPEENFESGFFYAEGRTESKGTIVCENLTGIGRGKAGGTVTNGTEYDMSYMAVWLDDSIKVFSDVKAGETVDLGQAEKDGRCVYDNMTASYASYSFAEELLYDMVSIYNHNDYDMEYEQDDMAALLIGLGIAENAKPTGAEHAVIIGVVRDYDRMTAGKCNETSYGCLYSYVEMGGGQNASN